MQRRQSFPSLSAQVLRRIGLEAPEAAAHERRAAERRAEFRLLHREPPFGRERQGIEQRIERRMKMQRRTEVVGAAALAGVAAENPPVEGNFRSRRPFDRMTGDAAARIDRAVVANGICRAGFDAAAAGAAPHAGERLVVTIAGRVEHQFAQQDERSEPGRDEQRLSADPAQPRFDGQLLFHERSRIDERPAGEGRLRGTKTPEEVAQHPLDRGMVVGGQGIRGDLRAEVVGITVAQAVLVTDGADDYRLRPFDQPSHVEPLVEIPFEVTERGVTPVAEPATEKLLVPHQMAARRYTAQVEACGSGGLSDETAVEHGDNLDQM